MTMPILLCAAGMGTRMGDLTRDRPKPLITVAGKPLIDHALDFAIDAGAAPVVVNVHAHPQMMRAHLAGHGVLISDETERLLETGGGLRKALPLLGDNPVLTMNTDAVWNGPNPVRRLLAEWRPEMEALLLMVAKENVSGHLGAGDFRIDGTGRLHRAPQMVYTGLQIMRTDVLSTIAEDAFSMNVAWNLIAARGGLFGAQYDGQWCDVGQPSSIPLAEAMMHV